MAHSCPDKPIISDARHISVNGGYGVPTEFMLLGGDVDDVKFDVQVVVDDDRYEDGYDFGCEIPNVQVLREDVEDYKIHHCSNSTS